MVNLRVIGMRWCSFACVKGLRFWQACGVTVGGVVDHLHLVAFLRLG